MRTKIIRITTVPISLKMLLKGQLRFMSENGFEVIGISSSGNELQEVEDEEGIRTIALEMTRTISPLKDLMTLWNFYKICKKEKPLIVHSHTPKAGIVGMLGAKLAGVPIRLHTVAGLPLMESKGVRRYILDLVEKLTYSCATKVYPISYGLEQFVLNNAYTSKEKTQVIANGSSNGINTQQFEPNLISEDQKKHLKSQLNINNDDFVFIFVGRLVSDKGVNELVEAFSKLAQPNVKLLLVGTQEEELDPLESRTIYEIQNNPNIISVGFQKDVHSYFAISDVLAFPSYREGFGNVVAQAGLMNLPCIVTDITGCNEIIIESENGTIIPVKNSEALVQAMQKMISDKVYYNNLKVNARAMILTRYEQSTVWNALLEEYNLLVNKLNK
ncbi:MAG TPA: glycosyltransferase family 4 protein [Flavobacterium sp.]|nr:glycosyltransferase family 4 protein [Flavobacterium sp.]